MHEKIYPNFNACIHQTHIHTCTVPHPSSGFPERYGHCQAVRASWHWKIYLLLHICWRMLTYADVSDVTYASSLTCMSKPRHIQPHCIHSLLPASYCWKRWALNIIASLQTSMKRPYATTIRRWFPYIYIYSSYRYTHTYINIYLYCLYIYISSIYIYTYIYIYIYT